MKGRGMGPETGTGPDEPREPSFLPWMRKGSYPSAGGTVVRNLSRRDFVKGGLTLAGSGLVLGVFAGCADDPAEDLAHGIISGATPGSRGTGAGGFEPNAFVRILPTGDVEITVARSEMGQGVRTTMASIVADELEADWDRIQVIQAQGDPRYGDQNTDGSTSVREFFEPLRQAGATGRRMLEQAAADQWEVPVDECRGRDHQVVHEASGRSAAYGDLVAAAAALPVPEDAPLKSPEEFRYIGKPVATLDTPDITTGRAVYGADVALPGMVYASVERSPTVGGTLRSYDDSAARAFPGVLDVVEISGGALPPVFTPIGGLAVVAENTWVALEARKLLQVEWEPGPNGAYESGAYRTQLEASLESPGRVARDEGDVEAALAEAGETHEAHYYVPHLAHAPMEPPACIATVADGRCEVWAPVQDPQATRGVLTQTLGLPFENVAVNVTLLGGAFGRKSKPDFVAEAALVSRAVGRPVRLQWSREDEIRHGFYHAVSAQRIEAAVGDDGLPTAWHHRTAFPSIMSTFAPNVAGPSDDELGLGAFTVPYNVPNLRLEACDAPAHVRIGWMRSVCNIHHSFAVGSFADELAHAAGRDPKDYLLDLIGPARILDLYDGGPSAYGVDTSVYQYDTARLRGVVERVARESGWGGSLPDGRARGIAAHYSFVTYTAHVVEASVDDGGRIRVHRVDCAVDCGRAVNPDRVRAQMEGAVVFGLSLALYGNISMRDGRVLQGNFNDYPILRLNETPEIHVHLMESEAIPTGVGEPGVPPVAPALANALFAATGQRMRELPLRV